LYWIGIKPSPVRPAAGFEAMICNAFGLVQDARVNARGMPSFLQLVRFAMEFDDDNRSAERRDYRPTELSCRDKGRISGGGSWRGLGDGDGFRA